MWFKFAWREISQSRRFSLFFILNLALGLFGFLSLDTFKTSFDQSLRLQSKNMLGADLAVSSRRLLTPSESKVIDQEVGQDSLRSNAILIYSMVNVGSGQSRLVELVGIDEKFPLYGEIVLRSGTKISQSGSGSKIGAKQVWVSPEFEAQMNTKMGDSLKVGTETVLVSDMIQSDTSNTWQSMSFAPRIYIGLEQLKQTGLIQPGSTLTYRWYYRTPLDQSEDIVMRLEKRLTDPSLQIASHQSASAQSGRMINYLNDYLGLVSLVALFLASVGAGYLFRSFLGKRLKEIGIYMSLGLTHSQARKIYLIQLGILGALAAVLAGGLSLLLLPALIQLLRDRFLLPIFYVFTPRSLVLSFGLGVLGSIFICLPLLEQIKTFSATTLFQDSPEQNQAKKSTRFQDLKSWIPAFLIFVGLSIWQANSLKIGFLFVSGFVFAGALIAFFARMIISLLGSLSNSQGLRVKLGLRSLAKNKVSSISCFLAIGLGSLLINLIPQIQQNLETEIVAPEVSEVPSLFFFDIQEEQLDSFTRFITQGGRQLKSISPLIRARLEKLNGAPFEKRLGNSASLSREEEREERSRNRGFNLTFRKSLSESESLVAGVPFSESSDQAEISVEKDFAERLKIKLGDVLTFDVQGVPIDGKVVNFRKVKWTSFQPNFFIQFQPGHLDDAPKTYLASIAHLSLKERADLQNQVVAQFPNISMIDISQVIAKLLNLFLQMGYALKLMAYLSLFAGFIVIFSIANHQSQARKTETQLLKILGADFIDVQSIALLEFTLIGFLASSLGAIFSLAMSFALARFVFDGLWVLSLKVPVFSVLGITFVCAMTTFFATRSVLQARVKQLIQTQ